MTLKVCPVPGCATLTEGGRCPTHRAEARHARGDRPNQYADRKLYARLRPHAIGKPCPRCGLPMRDDDQLQLGHTIDYAIDPTARPNRIEHALCNARAGGQLAHQLTPNTNR